MINTFWYIGKLDINNIMLERDMINKVITNFYDIIND